MSAPVRKYALTNLGSGDYLLPSNDGQALWRITRYEEDGSAEVSPDGKNWRRLKGDYWQTWKYKQPIPRNGLVDTDYEAWEPWDALLPTRAAAIEAALRHE